MADEREEEPLTSLLGRLLPLFTGVTRVEDLFTEAVARLFERRPELCLAWLDEAGLISPAGEGEQRHVRVNTQESFVRLEDHELGSRPDLILKVHRVSEDEEMEGSTEVVMFESKIGSWEGADQLKRYAGHLESMYGDKKTLVYITRNYDPKEPDGILSGHDSVRFEQLRWHDFYRFLTTASVSPSMRYATTLLIGRARRRRDGGAGRNPGAVGCCQPVLGKVRGIVWPDRQAFRTFGVSP